MPLSLEQLYAKINEARAGFGPLLKQQNELIRKYETEKLVLKTLEDDEHWMVLDEQQDSIVEYKDLILEIPDTASGANLIEKFNCDFAKYRDIKIDPQLTKTKKELYKVKANLINAIDDAVAEHNERYKQLIIRQRVELQQDEQAINLVTQKMQQLEIIFKDSDLVQEIDNAKSSFLDSVAFLYNNLKTLPHAITPELKEFIKQMHKEHANAPKERIFNLIKQGRLESELVKIAQIRATVDLYEQYQLLLNELSIEYPKLQILYNGFKHADPAYAAKAMGIDYLLEDAAEFLRPENAKIDNIAS